MKLQITNNKLQRQGFTLIELLVVISIIAILVGVSIFGLSGARESARDARRKSDLELIRSGLELYKSDCNRYPVSMPATGANLVGSTPPTSCVATNIYITNFPTDPTIGKTYRYVNNVATNSYVLCALLENPPSPAMSGVGACTGGCGAGACNYIVTNP